MKNLCVIFTKWCIRVVLCLQFLLPPQALEAQGVPAPVLPNTPITTAVTINGLTLNSEDPFSFDFIMEKGDLSLSDTAFKTETQKLINYFFAVLTVPDEEMWVNLSPYEEDHIVADGLSVTEMGRDMLVQDYLLKQITASLMNPDDKRGKRFWERIYHVAHERFGTTEIPVNTFNKVWIVPEEAQVYVRENSVYITNKHLKVMLEQDYVAQQHNRDKVAGTRYLNTKKDSLSSAVIREIIIPELEREVNEGEIFTNLRQIYDAMILATWYKRKFKKSILNQVYANQNKINGIDPVDPKTKEALWQEYVESFKKGVFDIVREEYDPLMEEILPRHYFAGGLGNVDTIHEDSSMSAIWLKRQDLKKLFNVSARGNPFSRFSRMLSTIAASMTLTFMSPSVEAQPKTEITYNATTGESFMSVDGQQLERKDHIGAMVFTPSVDKSTQYYEDKPSQLFAAALSKEEMGQLLRQPELSDLPTNQKRVMMQRAAGYAARLANLNVKNIRIYHLTTNEQQHAHEINATKAIFRFMQEKYGIGVTVGHWAGFWSKESSGSPALTVKSKSAWSPIRQSIRQFFDVWGNEPWLQTFTVGNEPNLHAQGRAFSKDKSFPKNKPFTTEEVLEFQIAMAQEAQSALRELNLVIPVVIGMGGLSEEEARYIKKYNAQYANAVDAISVNVYPGIDHKKAKWNGRMDALERAAKNAKFAGLPLIVQEIGYYNHRDNYAAFWKEVQRVVERYPNIVRLTGFKALESPWKVKEMGNAHKVHLGILDSVVEDDGLFRTWFQEGSVEALKHPSFDQQTTLFSSELKDKYSNGRFARKSKLGDTVNGKNVDNHYFVFQVKPKTLNDFVGFDVQVRSPANGDNPHIYTVSFRKQGGAWLNTNGAGTMIVRPDDVVEAAIPLSAIGNGILEKGKKSGYRFDVKFGKSQENRKTQDINGNPIVLFVEEDQSMTADSNASDNPVVSVAGGNGYNYPNFQSEKDIEAYYNALVARSKRYSTGLDLSTFKQGIDKLKQFIYGNPEMLKLMIQTNEDYYYQEIKAYWESVHKGKTYISMNEFSSIIEKLSQQTIETRPELIVAYFLNHKYPDFQISTYARKTDLDLEERAVELQKQFSLEFEEALTWVQGQITSESEDEFVLRRQKRIYAYLQIKSDQEKNKQKGIIKAKQLKNAVHRFENIFKEKNPATAIAELEDVSFQDKIEALYVILVYEVSNQLANVDDVRKAIVAYGYSEDSLRKRFQENDEGDSIKVLTGLDQILNDRFHDLQRASHILDTISSPEGVSGNTLVPKVISSQFEEIRREVAALLVQAGQHIDESKDTWFFRYMGFEGGYRGHVGEDCTKCLSNQAYSALDPANHYYTIERDGTVYGYVGLTEGVISDDDSLRFLTIDTIQSPDAQIPSRAFPDILDALDKIAQNKGFLGIALPSESNISASFNHEQVRNAILNLNLYKNGQHLLLNSRYQDISNIIENEFSVSPSASMETKHFVLYSKKGLDPDILSRIIELYRYDYEKYTNQISINPNTPLDDLYEAIQFAHDSAKNALQLTYIIEGEPQEAKNRINQQFEDAVLSLTPSAESVYKHRYKAELESSSLGIELSTIVNILMYELNEKYFEAGIIVYDVSSYGEELSFAEIIAGMDLYWTRFHYLRLKNILNDFRVRVDASDMPDDVFLTEILEKGVKSIDIFIHELLLLILNKESPNLKKHIKKRLEDNSSDNLVLQKRIAKKFTDLKDNDDENDEELSEENDFENEDSGWSFEGQEDHLIGVEDFDYNELKMDTEMVDVFFDMSKLDTPFRELYHQGVIDLDDIKKDEGQVVGGIDLNTQGLNLQEAGEAFEFNVDNALLNLQTDDVQGIRPVIINITPITNFRLFLGLKEEEEAALLAMI